MTITPQPYRHNSSDLSISELGDLIASIPGILGYYPQESAVVVSLLDDASGGALLGPVLRADLAHAEKLASVLGELPAQGVCGHLAVIVSRIPNSALVRDAADALYSATGGEGEPLVEACWHVSEIATGTPYTLMFGPSVEEMGRCGLPAQWVSGAVSSVMAQAAMAPLIAEGALPELDRGDARSLFDAVEDPRWPRDAACEARINRQGRELAAQLDTDPRAARATLSQACDVLLAARELPLVGVDAAPPLDALFTCRGEVELLAAALTDSRVRDCLLGSALQNPRGAAALFLAVARTFGGVVRANALSLWAVLAVHLSLSPWAWAAVERALEEVPGHSMAVIVAKLLRAGEYEGLVRCAELGCAQMWAELGGS